MLAERFLGQVKRRAIGDYSLSCRECSKRDILVACESKSCLPFPFGMGGKGLCKFVVKGEQVNRVDGRQ